MKRILIGATFVLIFLLIGKAVSLNAQAAELSLKAQIDMRKNITDERVRDNIRRRVGYKTRQSMKLEQEMVDKKLDRKAREERLRLKVEAEERQRAAEEKQRLAEERRLKEKREVASKIKKKESSRPQTVEKVVQNSNQSFNLSFYSTLPEENGGYSNMANGQSIHTATMVVASNYYPIGTKIYLEAWGTMTVSDRGGSAFNNPSRLDVLVQRKSGESTAAYKQRIRTLGRRTVSGRVLN